MSKHDEAIAAFREDRASDALRLLQELLDAGERSELWNDWGAVQLSVGKADLAEKGFSRALELDPENSEATINLGVLLLGQGDSARALPLLTSVLPLLPAAYRQIVNDMLAGKIVQSSSRLQDTVEKRQRVLVINDIFPDPCGDQRDRRLLQLLQALTELGDHLTFAAREGLNRKKCEPLLQQAGVQIYASDSEYAASLGHTVDAPSWSLPDLLARNQFDIAILIQSFGCGISVPEQYLDGLRQQSPRTRIAVFADELYVERGERSTAVLVDCERAEDWAARQWEIFERADAILVARPHDAATLRQSGRNLHVALISGESITSLADAQTTIRALTPKPYSGHPFSATLVETSFHQQLTTRVGEDRRLGQFEHYARLAELRLREGKPEEALAQLRHIFGRSPQSMHAGYFASQIFIILMRCYRALGNLDMAERCASEARSRAIAQTPSAPCSKRGKPDGPLFSVIVPTFNRLPILRKCLAALDAQTLAPDKFEVIVIDDGSSDGTHDLLNNYHSSFRIQYLRQANSGTGAARRNGVAHASGEYLLLMNDDTICDRDLLEEHLHTQTKYDRERWAVLGNFEYPAEARQRALTRYFCVEPFMFPQVSLQAGCPYGYSHFITCNLSVRRDAVVEAGSFDPTYKLSEDTELGIRLYEMGYRVLYHPDAHAIHDHLPYPARNLIRRARVYGADYFYMFGRHPRVMKDWAMPIPLTAMDEANALRILHYVEENRRDVEQAVEAIERWDAMDFDSLLTGQPETAAMVLNLFRQAVPAIHWFYLFETMLHTMIRELGLGHIVADGIPMRAHAAGVGS